ncbi:GNAT family N-acetyltransferase [Bacillus lacus]|uniref:GNAT family N-acetyltransferase n=1 Tax=Metabacillus lacus TaxID=1983721 RepID=A0A7X2J1X9_9BACI|nr:GNAT family N-acetyltransferase [Metabacillus lacus]MRX73845.1 GNAT family N-acetyltransferase [Metabacillus lacus]
MGNSVIEILSDQQVGELYELFSKEWWTRNRKREEIEVMIENSTVTVGILSEETGELIGFGRAISDKIFRAFIFDVIVRDSFRDKGIGQLVVQALCQHPDLHHTERIELYCPERLIPYYEKLGFSTEVNGSCLMRKIK